MLVDASDCFRATNQAGRMTGTGRSATLTVAFLARDLGG
jgi:hypothetical protein